MNPTEIKAIKDANFKDIIVKHPILGDQTFKVKLLDAKTLAEIEVDATKAGSTGDEVVDNFSSYQAVMYPIIKKVLPICCIDPKIVEGKAGDNELSLSDMPLEMASDLLGQVFKASGIEEDKEDDTKK